MPGLAFLTDLNLHHNQLGDEGLIAIAGALKKSETGKMTKLTISNNGIGPDGAKAVAALCAGSASIMLLNLSDNKIGPLGTKHLCDALTTNAVLTTLNLSAPTVYGGEIRLEGATHIAEMLRSQGSSSMTLLDVSRNLLDGYGVQLLRDAVRRREGFVLID